MSTAAPQPEESAAEEFERQRAGGSGNPVGDDHMPEDLRARVLGEDVEETDEGAPDPGIHPRAKGGARPGTD